MVYLGGVEGTFRLPHPVPEKLLFISAGSGITPVWSLIRSLARNDALTDAAHVHCCRDPDDFIFGETLRGLRDRRRGYELHEQHSTADGRLKPEDLDDLYPDWRERETFLSGPGEMIDAMIARWRAEGEIERLHIERFQPIIGGDETAEVGTGGTVRFRVSDTEGSCDGTTPILVCGEKAGASLPFGCRMGVCHTCKGKLEHGKVRDLRTGRVHGGPGEMVRTCINAPEGHVEIDL